MRYHPPQALLVLAIIVFAVAMTLWPQPVQAAVNCSNPALVCKSGLLSSDEVWTADKVYVVYGSVTVPAGVTLTIQAGTVVKFNLYTRLTIQGTLIANGVSGNLVYFTSIRDDTIGGDTDNEVTTPQPANWQYIQFQNGSTGMLQHVEIRYGGNYIEPMVQVEVNANVTIRASAFKFSYHCAIGMHPQNDVTLENMSPASFTGNVYNGLCVNSGDITADTTWDETEAVYILTGEVSVAFGKTLTLGPGVVIKLADVFLGANLLVNGTLRAQGTADQPIYFTSIYDNTIGGASGNTTTTPSPGNWGWVLFRTGSSGVLDYVEMRYGGKNARDAILRQEVGAAVSINAGRFVSGRRCPLSMPPQNDFTLSNMSPASFTGNEFNGICVDSGGVSANTTWDETEAPYVPQGDITVAFGATLTWGPGIVVKPRDLNTDFIIDGVLNVNGVAGQPVTLTSVRDDTIGGSTDNTTNPPAPGDWGRILFRSTGAGELNQLELRYGGQGWSVLSMLEQDVGANVIINGGAFQYGSGCALATHPQNDFTIINLTRANVTGNRTNGLCVKSGGISANTTWDETEIPYVPQGDITVAFGATLTWGPGIVIKPYNTETDFVIDGVLNANGATGQPVVVTSLRDNTIGGSTGNDTNPPERGDWGRILVRSNGSATLNMVELRYGGRLWFNLPMVEQALGAQVTINASTFRYGSGCAVAIHPQTDVTLTDMTVANFSGNGTNGICVQGGGIASDTTWDETEAPYVPQGDITVTAGVTLRWGPGVVIKPKDASVEFLIDGILNANGTQSQPIYVTSINDSTVGGATVSSTTPPAPGQWGRLLFRSGSSGTLSYIVVRYGGDMFSASAAIHVDNASPVLRYCTLANNRYGLRSSGTAANPVVEYCNIVGNTTAGIQNDTPNHWISAPNNWWGNVTGPNDASNADGLVNNGSGDKVSNFVQYRPWLQGPVIFSAGQYRVYVPQIVR